MPRLSTPFGVSSGGDYKCFRIASGDADLARDVGRRIVPTFPDGGVAVLMVEIEQAGRCTGLVVQVGSAETVRRIRFEIVGDCFGVQVVIEIGHGTALR